MAILRSVSLPVSTCTCGDDDGRALCPSCRPDDAHPIRFLNADQVCAKLSIGKRTLWRLVVSGRLPQPIRLSRKLVRWTLADVEAAMREMTAARAPKIKAVPLPKPRLARTDDGAVLLRCPTCNRFCTSYEGVDGETEWVCVDCDTFAPVSA